MAIRPIGRRAGGGADMGEEHRRPDMPTEMLEVLVGPGRADLTIEAGFVTVAVPAKAEAVAIGGADRFLGPEALDDQRMSGLGDVALQRDRFPAVGNPAAHRANPNPAVKNTTNAAAAKRCGRPLGPVFGEYCAQTMIRFAQIGSWPRRESLSSGTGLACTVPQP